MVIPLRSAEPSAGGECRASSQAGAAGAGDACFPFAGNGGYDVKHYDLDLTYTPPEPDPAPLVGQLSGEATINLVATQDLNRFNFDLRGMDAQAITINGKRAKEVITPPLRAPRSAGGCTAHIQDVQRAADHRCRRQILTSGNLATTNTSLALQKDMIAFLERTFAKYPFVAFGSIVDDDTVG